MSSIDPLVSLFQGVRQALLTQPPTLTAFLPIFRGLTVSEHFVDDKPHPSAIQDPDLELSTLLAFFRDEFPQPSLSSPGLWAAAPKGPMRDLTTIAIHGRLAVALSQPQSPRNLCQLRFLVIVIILHQLGHAIATRFQKGTISMEDNVFPFYVSCRAPPVMRFPEQGFLVEEALFGGIVGVVFDDELDSLPPPFFQSDFTKISHLFLHCRDGRTYRLDAADIEERMTACRLTPFDVSMLQAVSLPKRIRDRTCAMFNGDHLVVHEPAGGDPEPLPDMSYFHPPVWNTCGIRR